MTPIGCDCLAAVKRSAPAGQLRQRLPSFCWRIAHHGKWETKLKGQKIVSGKHAQLCCLFWCHAWLKPKHTQHIVMYNITWLYIYIYPIKCEIMVTLVTQWKHCFGQVSYAANGPVTSVCWTLCISCVLCWHCTRLLISSHDCAPFLWLILQPWLKWRVWSRCISILLAIKAFVLASI